jgi:hypothetical protein
VKAGAPVGKMDDQMAGSQLVCEGKLEGTEYSVGHLVVEV